jgi:threonine/homoserine/homoserine lactone efflux protein
MGADLAASHASVAAGLLLSLGILVGVALFFCMLVLLIHFGRRFFQPKYLRYVSLLAGIVLLLFCLKFGYDLVEMI